jgi:AraC-like DNA-binding protein
LPLSDIEDTTLSWADEVTSADAPYWNMHSQFIALFERDKIWLKSDLSAQDVVRILGTNRTYFSRFMQDQYATNFRTFVNEYRIKEAKSILETDPLIPMSEIAIQTGFASISSFNGWFHKLTTVSPTQYKENLKTKVS